MQKRLDLTAKSSCDHQTQLDQSNTDLVSRIEALSNLLNKKVED